jgi:spoIIIJ-associated protein
MMADTPIPSDLQPAADETPLSDADHALQVARDTLVELLAKMKISAQVAAAWDTAADPGEPSPLLLEITGEDLGILIGPRGETVAALQYIARLIISKELGEGVNVLVDVEGHRRRREEQLRRMARKMAEQVVQRQRTMALEPMTPAERRIIHLELREHPEVYTESVGEGDKRKVTILLKKPSK